MDGKIHIFSILRKKYLQKTPEELVRQCFVNYLISNKGYPKSLMKEEYFLTYNGQKKRADLVVFDQNLKAQLLAEFKAQSVSLSQSAALQIAKYNFHMQVPILVISNLDQTYIFKKKQEEFIGLADIPLYKNLTL
tara:strand:+ start:655 stop:1059 length:405 start_codon:yes stop_codon:yes gene_type:complete